MHVAFRNGMKQLRPDRKTSVLAARATEREALAPSKKKQRPSFIEIEWLNRCLEQPTLGRRNNDVASLSSTNPLSDITSAFEVREVTPEPCDTENEAMRQAIHALETPLFHHLDSFDRHGGQPQPQTNREYVFEDPLAPLRLPPLAQISEFWRRYDRLADIHDKRLTVNLNGNLDVLLIFAALFSAINTTFITITMPDLSPNSSDETNNLLRLLVMRADNNTLAPSDLVPPFSPSSNSIIVNSLLYASLSCSLLAAVGAMMAKEWLQSFDRTGQTGPLEEQALFRQRKFNGVLEWHLEA
ncbi:hypothetical protein FRC00_004406, partial [Tulasnella sp. 408]